jgi:membrane protein insertase Oxa1/YidC/SpoIIIJ
VLVARELDAMILGKVEEDRRMQEVERRIKEIQQVNNRSKEMDAELQDLMSKREIVSGNGCILLYRSML